MSTLDAVGTGALVAAGAAVGAPVRYLLGSWLDREVPRGTLTVNLVGSFALGLLSALSLDGRLLAMLGTGFCGALTTYSSFAVQTHRLASRSRRASAAYAVGTVGGGLVACALGFVLGAGPLG